jgi:hypothetical protein
MASKHLNSAATPQVDAESALPADSQKRQSSLAISTGTRLTTPTMLATGRYGRESFIVPYPPSGRLACMLRRHYRPAPANTVPQMCWHLEPSRRNPPPSAPVRLEQKCCPPARHPVYPRLQHWALHRLASLGIVRPSLHLLDQSAYAYRVQRHSRSL